MIFTLYVNIGLFTDGSNSEQTSPNATYLIIKIFVILPSYNAHSFFNKKLHF